MRSVILVLGLLLASAAPAADKAKDLLRQVTGNSTTSTTAAKSGLTEGDASAGIKEALARGVSSSIKQLGTQDGFLKDQVERSAVPKSMRKMADAARKLGADKYVEEFETSI